MGELQGLRKQDIERLERSLKREKDDRARDIQDLKKRYDDLLEGSFVAELVGVVTFSIGITYATIPSEVAKIVEDYVQPFLQQV